MQWACLGGDNYRIIRLVGTTLLPFGYVVTVVTRLAFTKRGDFEVPIMLSEQAVFEWRHLNRRCH